MLQSATVLQWYSVTVLQWYSVTECHSITVLQSHSITVLQSVTVPPWNVHTELYVGTSGPTMRLKVDNSGQGGIRKVRFTCSAHCTRTVVHCTVDGQKYTKKSGTRNTLIHHKLQYIEVEHSNNSRKLHFLVPW